MKDKTKLNEVAEATQAKGKLTLTIEASQRLARHLYFCKRNAKHKQIFYERKTALGWLRLEVDTFLEVGIVTLETERMRTARTLAPPTQTKRSRNPNPRERQEMLAKIRREQADPELAYHRGYRSC